MPTIPFLGIESLEKLRQDHERLRLEVVALRQQVRALAAMSSDGCQYRLAKADGSGVSAMSGDTVGTGTATLYRLPAGETDIVEQGHDITVYNAFGAVAANAVIGVIQGLDRKWWVIAEAC